MNKYIKALFDFVLIFCSVLIAVSLSRALYNKQTDINNTQPAIQTDIVSVRGCDIIQLVQDDKLITAFPAPDQPKSCKVQQQPERKKK